MTFPESDQGPASLARQIEFFLPKSSPDILPLAQSEVAIHRALGAVMINFGFLEQGADVDAAGIRQMDRNLAHWLYQQSDPKHNKPLTIGDILTGLTYAADCMDTQEFKSNVPSKTHDVIEIATMPDKAMAVKIKSDDLEFLHKGLYRRAKRALQVFNSLSKTSWQALVDDEHPYHDDILQTINNPIIQNIFNMRLRNESGLAGAFQPITALRALVEQDWEENEPLKSSFLDQLILDFRQDSLIAVVPQDLPWYDPHNQLHVPSDMFDDLQHIPHRIAIQNLMLDPKLIQHQHGWALNTYLSDAEAGFLDTHGYFTFGVDIQPPSPQAAALGWSKQVKLLYLVKDSQHPYGFRPRYTSLLVSLDHPEPVYHFDLLEQPSETSSTLSEIHEVLRPFQDQIQKIALNFKPANITITGSTNRAAAPIKPRTIKTNPAEMFVEPPISTTEAPKTETWDIIPLEELNMPDAHRQIAESTLRKWKDYDYERISRFIKKYKGPGRLIRLRNNRRERVFLLEQPDGRLKVINVMEFKTKEDYDRYCAKPIDQYPLKRKQ